MNFASPKVRILAGISAALKADYTCDDREWNGSPFAWIRSKPCCMIPKGDIIRLWKHEQGISSQHGGAGGSDTAWIDVVVDSPPSWLSQYGGTLGEALRELSKITGYTPEPITIEYENG